MGTMRGKFLYFATKSMVFHWCPACDEPHGIAIEAQRPGGAVWSFNGDERSPTFTPSVRCFTTRDDNGEPLPNGGQRTLCHYFIKDGRIEFCGDNPHAMNGKTVDMVEYPASWTRGDDE